MMRDIYLHGSLGRTYGRRFRLSIDTPLEAIQALSALRKGFANTIRKARWRVIVGSPRLRNIIDRDSVAMNLGHQPLHIVPGTNARGEDLGKTILGVVLIGAALIFSGGTAAGLAAPLFGSFAGLTYGTVLTLGIATFLGGISRMISTPPKADAATDQAAPADRPSFLFNGVVNNSQEGGPVPLVFGTFLTGSVVVNAGITTEDIPV